MSSSCRIYLASTYGPGGSWLRPLLDEKLSSRKTAPLPADEGEIKCRYTSREGFLLNGASSPIEGSGVAARVNLLESFYYVADWQTRNLHRFKSFMLDSGAFTFAYGSGAEVDWDDYLERYIAYIVENNVGLFFELDIDKLVGYEKVLEYRKRLEDGAGRRCIPVWHMNRGREDWLKTCDEYDYIGRERVREPRTGNPMVHQDSP